VADGWWEKSWLVVKYLVKWSWRVKCGSPCLKPTLTHLFSSYKASTLILNVITVSKQQTNDSENGLYFSSKEIGYYFFFNFSTEIFISVFLCVIFFVFSTRCSKTANLEPGYVTCINCTKPNGMVIQEVELKTCNNSKYDCLI
jgi:hypothetical protein